MPVLDLLLKEVPEIWQSELRLGLQEALVNAVKHGNSLDPCKQITVRFSILPQMSAQVYWWVITDQGDDTNRGKKLDSRDPTPCEDLECGRGFYILRKIFDQVIWDYDTHCLTLCKRIDRDSKPLIF